MENNTIKINSDKVEEFIENFICELETEMSIFDQFDMDKAKEILMNTLLEKLNVELIE